MANDLNNNTPSTSSNSGDVSSHLNDQTEAVISLLKQLITLPSFSREEDKTATAIEAFLHAYNVPAERYLNNIWVKNKYYDPAKPTILLNSHHDTVKPNKGYTLDPFTPIEKDGKLYGLGSNDAGGALISLLAVFLHFYDRQDTKYNLIYAATAEEEISGKNGIEGLLKAPKFLQSIGTPPEHPFETWCAIVGEPTLMQMAVAERGLMVLDCTASGKAGHAARNEGENALYKAIQDINWFQSYQFPKVSDLIGPVKMSVTVIETENKAHNVVPAQCKFVVDVRVNELYTFEEVLEVIRVNVQCEVQPRSCRLRSTSIPLEHPLVQAGMKLGRSYYGSPTSSDKALMPFLALKIGPGDSARSHTADEFVYIDEIKEGIGLYINLLNQVL
jgi:acetylornithine deacetylase